MESLIIRNCFGHLLNQETINGGLLNLINLRVLDVCHCTDNDLVHISNMQKLEELNLLGCISVTKSYFHLIYKLSNLKKLTFVYKKGFLEGIKNLRNLKYLYINTPKSLYTIPISLDFQQLYEIKKLETLKIEGNYILGDCDCIFTQLYNLKNLYINLFSVGKIKKIFINEITKSKKLSNLCFVGCRDLQSIYLINLVSMLNLNLLQIINCPNINETFIRSLHKFGEIYKTTIHYTTDCIDRLPQCDI